MIAMIGLMMTDHERRSFEEYRALIRSWHGARGQITQHANTSHSVTRIELTRPQSAEALLIVCYLPTYIAGPVRWANACLDVWEVPESLRNHLEVPEQVLFDPFAGMRIRCLKINAVLIPLEEATRG